jgi:hypothetical protein
LSVGGTLDVTGAITSSAGATITTADNTAQLTLKSTDADSSVGPVLDLVRDSASPADGDAIGQIKHTADNDAGEATTYASNFVTLRDASDGAEDGQIIQYVMTNGSLVDHLRMGRGSAGGQSEVVVNEGSADIDFRVESDANANCLFVDAGNDKIGIRTGTPQFGLSFSQGTSDSSRLGWHDSSNNKRASIICSSASDSLSFHTGTSDTERMRIQSGGNLLVGKTTAGSSQTGFEYEANNGATLMTRSQLTVLIINRLVTDGQLVEFRHDGGVEGGISVSGSTVSFNGGHLSRWSRLADDSKDTNIVKGTVMTNLDKMVVWHHEAKEATLYEDGDEIPEGKKVGDEKTPAVEAYDEDNEQLNCMAVSSVEGDINVAGVFVNWDEDDDYNDMNVAMTGDMVIRIAKDTTVERGNLLMSAGDGTAKPQGDSYVQDKTIAKVTSTTKSHTYDDGSYLVPCVLMAC